MGKNMTWHEFDNLDAITADSVTSQSIGEALVSVALINGEYYAFDTMCSHAKISMAEGPLCGFEIECPAHGARFDVRDGSAKCLPATRAIATYPTKVEDGALYVEL